VCAGEQCEMRLERQEGEGQERSMTSSVTAYWSCPKVLGEDGEIFICKTLIVLLFLSHSMEDRTDNMPLWKVS